MSNSWLDLLSSVGVDIDVKDWDREHPPPTPPPERTKPGFDPVWTDHKGLPYFSAAQIDWCEPEVFGIDQFGVIEDDDSAHPFVLSWKDEVYYRANYRAKHRYSRPYRLRWTLAYIVGICCNVHPPTLVELQRRLALEPKAVIHTRGAYEWVRKQLAQMKMTKFNMSIPGLVRRLGGPGWKVSTSQYNEVVAESERVHRAFERDKGTRQRFPKMQYVLLRALDRVGVAPPYHVKWARTSIKRRQLCEFLSAIDDNGGPQAQVRPNH